MLELKKGLRLETLQLPFKQALAVASRIGADGVEINARSHLRPSELSRTGLRHLSRMLEDLKLRVCAIHFPIRRGFANTDHLEERIAAAKGAIEFAYNLGTNVVVSNIGPVPDDRESPEWNTMYQALTDLGMYSQRTGAWLATATGDQPTEALKGIIDVLPPMTLGIDFDPGNILINGFSPVEAMKALSENVMSFRVRDAVRDLSQGRGLEVQLGRGSVDWPSLLGTLEQRNYSGYLIVDRTAGPQEVIQQSAESLEYLQQLFT